MIAGEAAMDAASVEGKRVVVVGGGMASAQLALAALRLGASRVALICRHALTVQEWDCEVSAVVWEF